MAVSGIEIRSRRPFAEGQVFGDRGRYERIEGIVQFAVDPIHAANHEIVDLERAPRDAAGRIRFEADFLLLQPSEPARANRRLLFHVVNRGRVGAVPFGRAPTPQVPTDLVDPGDGFLMRHGWTVLAVGWQWDVERRTGLIGLEAPPALDEHGRPIQGRAVIRFQPNEPHPDQHLAHMPLHPPPGRLAIQHRPYPAADVDDPDATVTVRDTPLAAPTTIPRQRWRFAREEAGRPVPDDTRVWLEGGFEPGRIYEVSYRTRICPVVGTGLLAVRDSVAWWRHATHADGNPSAGQTDFAYGWGVSQCGRFLRSYLYHGLNLDESGRIVFDGVIPHVAGARTGEFNHRYAQPSAQHVPGVGHRFPFATEEQTDAIAGERDGLLRRQRALGGVPKVILSNTSSEYWRIDCSLIHTDTAGTRDVEPPPDVRVYLLAGTQHGAGTLPLTQDTPAGARTANRQNVVDYAPLTRALLINLDRWASDGDAPPPSTFPRLADGTAVPRETILEWVRTIPGAALPDSALLPRLRRVDLGSGGMSVPELPARLGEPFPSFVSAVDADGNEVAGIRLPDLTVPVAAHTGWVPRHPEIGGAGQIVDMQGSTLPLPGTPEERRRTGDPRRSIGERYRDREDYLGRVRAAAEALVQQRYILAEDVEIVVSACAARYDAVAPRPALVT